MSKTPSPDHETEPDHPRPFVPVDLAPLQTLITRLRAPDGCPWDREQTLDDLRAYLIEEAHEVGAAIADRDHPSLREELGDLLFQVVFIGHLAEEEGTFRLADSAEDIHRKMVIRHPHVFGDPGTETDSRPTLDADDVARAWEQRKAEARPERSVLDGVPRSLPGLTAAYRLTQKAAGVGFDWPDALSVLAKVREELGEVEAAMAAVKEAAAEKAEAGTETRAGDTEAASAGSDPTREHLEEELGDLLFAVANLARHYKIDPELALARGNSKFGRRFRALEDVFRQRNQSLAASTLEEMDAVWEHVKKEEKGD